MKTVITAGITLLLASVAWASPPTDHAMGATFQVISQGPTSVIEIRLKPRASFDTISVEAGSGVGSLTPACSFTAVVAGGSYTCQINVSQKTGEASLTLNVVGEKTGNPGRPGIVQVSHFTLANPEFVAPAAKRLETRPGKRLPRLMLTPPQGASK